jgi:uncharacterized protein (TIGR02271 family)
VETPRSTIEERFTMTHAFETIQEGWDAYGSDGEKIGEVQDLGPNYVHVSKGLILVTDLFIPHSAIEGVDADRGRVLLNVPKSQVEDMGWDEPPAETTGRPDAGYRETDTVSGRSTGTAATAGTAGATSDYGRTADRGRAGTDDTMRVPVHEEEIRAGTHQREAGDVQVDKRVVEEQRDTTVPVSHDEVDVRRVRTDRPATGDEAAFQDGDTIRVPVTAEEVEVRKEPRVVEEIEIDKRRVTEDQKVSEGVRREEVDVRETGNVAAMGKSDLDEKDRDRY